MDKLTTPIGERLQRGCFAPNVYEHWRPLRTHTRTMAVLGRYGSPCSYGGLRSQNVDGRCSDSSARFQIVLRALRAYIHTQVWIRPNPVQIKKLKIRIESGCNLYNVVVIYNRRLGKNPDTSEDRRRRYLNLVKKDGEGSKGDNHQSNVSDRWKGATPASVAGR